MTRDEVQAYCKTLAGAVLDQPFEDDFDSVAARHADTRKWFALLMTVKGRPALNLKCDPQKAMFWRDAYDCVTPAWHMNKTHWNTVWLDGEIAENDLLEMIDDSYHLTLPRRKGRRESL